LLTKFERRLYLPSEAAHAARMHAIHRQRVLERNKKYLASLDKLEANARSDEKLWRQMISDQKSPFTPAQFQDCSDVPAPTASVPRQIL